MSRFSVNSRPIAALLETTAHAAEWESLAREADPEIFHEGLFQLGQRLEAENQLETASEVYAAILQPEIPEGIRQRAQRRLDAITGAGSSSYRAEFLLRRLARETMEPTTLVGMTAASAAFRMTRLAVLSRLVGAPTTNFVTRGFAAQATASLVAFGVEATVFPLAGRGAAASLGRDLDWSFTQVAREIAGSFIVLGAMKLTGSAVGRVLTRHANVVIGGSRPALQQLGMFSGITLGHYLETSVGLRPHVDGATTFVDSLAMLVQFNVAGRLAHGMMGQGFRTWEMGLDHQARTLATPPLPIPPPRGGRGLWNEVPLSTESLAFPSPLEGEGPRRGGEGASHIVLMSEKNDGGNEPPPRPGKPSGLGSPEISPIETIEEVRVFRDSVRRNLSEAIWTFVFLYNEAYQRPLLGYDRLLSRRLERARANLILARNHIDLLEASKLRVITDKSDYREIVRILDRLPDNLTQELRKTGMTPGLALSLRRSLDKAFRHLHSEDEARSLNLREHLPLAPLPRLHPPTATREQIRGMLLGGAVGDAFGAPFEFMMPEQIAERRPDFSRFTAKGNRRPGQWTDDTLMVLATMDSLLQEGAVIPRRLAEAFGRLGPQQKERGFGHATKTAIQRAHRGRHWSQAGWEDAESNGAAMRIAPIAAFSYRNLETVKRNGLLAGQITHAGYESLSGALGVSFILAKILRGEFQAGRVLDETRRFIGPGRFSAQLLVVQYLLSQKNLETSEGIRRLGTSGLVWESVSAAIYAFLRNPNDFRASLEATSRAGGDTDTMAAIAGALSGAFNGEAAIPENLRRDLEAGDSIREKADRLFMLLQAVPEKQE